MREDDGEIPKLIFKVNSSFLNLQLTSIFFFFFSSHNVISLSAIIPLSTLFLSFHPLSLVFFISLSRFLTHFFVLTFFLLRTTQSEVCCVVLVACISFVSKWMSFKVFTYILKNALIKRKRDVILPNYLNQLLVCFSLKKKIILWK